MQRRTKAAIGAAFSIGLGVATWLTFSPGRSEAGWTPAGCSTPTFGGPPIPLTFDFHDDPYSRGMAPAYPSYPSPPIRSIDATSRPIAAPTREPAPPKRNTPIPVKQVRVPTADELGIRLDEPARPLVPPPEEIGIHLK